MKGLNISALVCHHDMGIVHGLPKAGMLFGPADVKEHPDDDYKLLRQSQTKKMTNEGPYTCFLSTICHRTKRY